MKSLITSIFFFVLCIIYPYSDAHASTSNCTSANCQAVAQAVYHEARGEGERGMQAVANVIMNRTETRNLTPKQVVHQRGQFSYRLKRNLTMKELNSRILANEIAYKAVTGQLKDITHGATYFRTTRSGTWGPKFKRTVTIGNHSFFKKR